VKTLQLKKFALASVLASVTVCATAADSAADANALTVCLNKDNAPFSQKKDGKESGYDLLVTQAVAKQLGKPLAIKWYEKERRSRGSVSVKASVLINAGVCQLIGGFPLLQSSLDRPGAGESATLPPVDGIPVENRKQAIKGSQLYPSQPYHFAGVTPVFGANVTQQKLESLDDLKPYKIGNRPAAIGDLIAMAYKQGLLMKNVTHVDVQAEPLDALSKGEFDVTIIEAHKFDMYRADNPQTVLRASGMVLPVGFNLGFVTTEEHAELLKAVSAAVEALAKSGEMEKTARVAGITYIAPQQPAVRSGLGLEKIAQ
jgi:ABC-type amino acid transport substrate-binding protein